MASLDCPLAGDAAYGAPARVGRLAEPARTVLTAVARPAPHAQILGFAHPVTGKALEFEQRWPEDLDELRRGLLVRMIEGRGIHIRQLSAKGFDFV